MFQTVTYLNYWLHLKTRGNKTEVTVQEKGTLTVWPRKYPSLRAAQKAILRAPR